MRVIVVLLVMLCGWHLSFLSAEELSPSLSGAHEPLAKVMKVAYLPITGEIDGMNARYFKRALAEACEAKMDAVVVRIETDGGELGAGREMLAAAMAIPKDHPRMIAFVDNHCYSAGALIAYGHDEIYLAPGATIGDIGVIMIGSDGKIEYAPEKMETVVRTLLRNTAQAKGWNEAKLVKMTARQQELYRFDTPSGQQFVLEDDLPSWLKAHPAVDPAGKIIILGKDRLRSYTAHEAVDDQMATSIVNSIDDIYKKLGVESAQVVDLSPTQTEMVGRFLAGWSSISAALAMLCVFLEMKSPGVGIWAVLAVVFGSAFFVCQFYQELASYLEVVMVVIGIACVIAELFFFPTMGWLALVGVALMLSGLVLAFMPDAQQFHPDAAGWDVSLLSALKNSVLAMAVITAGAIMILITLPNSAFIRRIAARAEISGSSASAVEAGGSLVGRVALTRTPLSPSGSITIDGKDLSATSEHGEFVEVGTNVDIVAMRYGGAVVRPRAVSA